MKIIAFTGAGISKQSNIPTFMERPDVREKLFRSYAQSHHEEYNEVIRQLKANMNVQNLMMLIMPWRSIIFLLSQ